MSEANKQNEKKTLKSIEIAVKWWADRLDGTVRDIRLTDRELEEALELLREIGYREEADEWTFKFKIQKEKKFELLYLFPAERERFEAELTKYLEREIESKGCAELYVGEDGAEMILSWAAEKCEIDYGKGSVFTFAPCVDMFVEKDKVAVRFGEDEPLETIFKERRESVWESSCKKNLIANSSKEEVVKEK